MEEQKGLTINDILKEFPNQFERSIVQGSIPMNFEITGNNKEKEEVGRFILSKDDIFLINVDGNLNTWDLDMRDVYINTDISRNATHLRIRNKDSEDNLEHKFLIQRHGIRMNIVHLPLNENNANYILQTLRRRKKFLLQN